MDNRFRNHPSLILEQIGAFWGAVILFLILNFDIDEWKELSKDMKITEDLLSVLIVFGIMTGIFLLRTVLSIIRWYKTWIILDETSITISVNTLKQSVNTIGIKNISNVNIERNIFERIIGTSKVKLDTDSYSTAETTDVEIILKKDKAEQLKQYLMEGAREERNAQKRTAVDEDNAARQELAETDMGISDTTAQQRQTATDKNDSAQYDVYYNNKNIILHCIHTAPITGIIITLAGILLFTAFFAQQISEGGLSLEKIMGLLSEALSAALVAIMVFFSAAYSLIKDFIKYYKFQARRIDNRIQIEFGLLKRISYEIPVNRINSIVINKSVISRFTHHSCVDLINVGIGDEKEENTRLLLSVPDKYLAEVMHRILPEFDEFFQINSKSEHIRQPREIWWKHGFGACKILIAAMLIFVVIRALIALDGIVYAIYAGCVIAFICFYLLGCYGSYLADGLWLHEKYLAVSSGIFAMTIQFVKYSKIQHMVLLQGPVERCFNLQRGTVYILASALKSIVNIPAFEKRQTESMARLFLESKG